MGNIYFCLHCQEYYDLCGCCNPPGGHIDGLHKLTIEYLRLFEGTQWNHITSGQVPMSIRRQKARQAAKRYRPELALSLGDSCPTCREEY